MIEDILIEIVENQGIAGSILIVMAWLVHQNTKVVRELTAVMYEIKGKLNNGQT